MSLHRTQDPLGTWTYALREWLTIPDAPRASGELRATVRFPGGHEATTAYSLMVVPSVPTEVGPP